MKFCDLLSFSVFLFYRTMWSCSLLVCVILILCEYSNASQIVRSLTDQHGMRDLMVYIIASTEIN